MKVYVVYFHGTYETGIGEYEEYDVIKAFSNSEEARLFADLKNIEHKKTSVHNAFYVREMEVQ